MDLNELLTDLGDLAVPVADLVAPPFPGIYALFVREGVAVEHIVNGSGGILYVGTSNNLAQRAVETHFTIGQSGFSTVRRSLGALLRTQLGLQPRPRADGPSDTNFRNYRFDDAGEQRLTDWMTEHLTVAVQPLDEPDGVEDDLIALARAPLNLTGWPNPHALAIKAARKFCVNAARATDP